MKLLVLASLISLCYCNLGGWTSEKIGDDNLKGLFMGYLTNGLSGYKDIRKKMENIKLITVSSQVVAGMNYKFNFKDGDRYCELVVYEVSWMNSKSVTSDNCSLAITSKRQLGGMAGGLSAADVNDPNIKRCLAEGLDKINAMSNDMFRLVETNLVARKQVVAGMKYYLSFQTVESSDCMNSGKTVGYTSQNCTVTNANLMMPMGQTMHHVECVSVPWQNLFEVKLVNDKAKPAVKPKNKFVDTKLNGKLGILKNELDGKASNMPRKKRFALSDMLNDAQNLLGKDGHDLVNHGKKLLGKDGHDLVDHVNKVLGGDTHDWVEHGKKLLGGDNHDLVAHASKLIGGDTHDFLNHGSKMLGGDDHDKIVHGTGQLLGRGNHDYVQHTLRQLGKDGHDMIPHGNKNLGGDGHDMLPHGNKNLGGDGHDMLPHGNKNLGGDGHDMIPHDNKILGGDGHDMLPHGNKNLGGDGHDMLPHGKPMLGGDTHDKVPHGNETALLRTMFKKFQREHNKMYGSDKETEKRFMTFCDNMRMARKLQDTEQGTAVYGATMFADLTGSEFKQHVGKKWDQSANQWMRQAEIPRVTAPEAFDWRDHGAVTPVKNQGSCGSCWAFSTTGNIEGQWFIKKGKLVSLSEQELVDCDKVDEGCNGGLPSNAYKEIERLGGLETETEYSYKGEDEKCEFIKRDVKAYINDSVSISSDEKEMASWLAQNGPISIGINAFAMQFYMGGIAHPWKILCNPSELDHGVLIVGYGVQDDEPYWIVKNSWGPSWGEKGYYLVYRGDGVCGLNTMCTSSVVN